MDATIGFLAQLDVPPALVAALAAFTVGSVLYELLVRRRIAASQAEKNLRGFLSDDAGNETVQELPVDSWGYKFRVAGLTGVQPEQARTYLYGGSALLGVVAFLVAASLARPGQPVLRSSLLTATTGRPMR